MKTLVTYFSQTGKTKLVAEAIFGAVEGEKDLKPMEEVVSWEGYDLVFVGFPVIAFGPAPQAKEFLKKHGAGKKVALLITHAAPEGDEKLTEWLAKCREAAAGADLLGMFDCQGELSEQIADLLLKSDDPLLKAFGERRGETIGQPDESRLQKARLFAAEIMGKAKKGY
jgi:flavodoxin